jgi:hypothetical protein
MKAISVVLFIVVASALGHVHAISGNTVFRRNAGVLQGKCPGKCQNRLTIACNNGAYKPLLCDGPPNIQCCIPGATPVPDTKFKALPKFEDMWAAYPHGEAKDVKKLLGGAVDADWVTNTCVVRVSYVLGKLGQPVPVGSTNKGVKLTTIRTAANMPVAFRVAELNPYMQVKYGPPAVTVKNPGAGVPDAFKNKVGIIQFVVAFSDASGHFDLWDGFTQQCAHDCYWDRCSVAYLWLAS